MIAYLDSSALLRIVLKEQGPLNEWPRLEGGVCSRLVVVECERTLNRYWLEDRFDEVELQTKREELLTIINRLDMVPLDESILHVAAQPLP